MVKSLIQNEMKENSIEAIEVKLLTDAIFYAYGYDFRKYTTSSNIRRFLDIKATHGFKSFAEMQHKILHDRKFFLELLSKLTITVTEFYRDPLQYSCIKEHVFDHLKTYPTIKIWHAGCSTGEEVYSLSILLKEANLYDKCIIYATDINPKAIEAAKRGYYSLDKIKQGSEQYFEAGGELSLSEYYRIVDNQAIIRQDLKENIVFSDHNLATDHCFAEMQLIFCRNVMIYFNHELRDRALNIIDQSLCSGGFLVLGHRESLLMSNIMGSYEEINKKEKIYRKKWI